MSMITRNLAALVGLISSMPAHGQSAQDFESLRDKVEAEKSSVEEQRKALDESLARLRALEETLLGMVRGTGAPQATQIQPTTPTAQAGVQAVGEAPKKAERPPEVAALPDQGGVVTRQGQLTLEGEFDYGRSDRTRVIFRGIEVPTSVLVGVFDINENHQDTLTTALNARLGLTNRLELGVKVPFVYRAENSVLAPVVRRAPEETGLRNQSINAAGLGDIEMTARFQLNDGSGGWPFLIANAQAVIPTGSDPFQVPRDTLGVATEAATGAGFWAAGGSITAIALSDPVVFFGNIGYTHNFARVANVFIGDALVGRVKPGDALSASVGISLSLNQRTSLSLGYAHSWSRGTSTITRLIDRSAGTPLPPVILESNLTAPFENKSRDLQVGRLLFGIAYRLSDRTTLNWNLQVGATQDAPDVRVNVRIPFNFRLWD
jgi:hypothetical protein